MIQLNLESFAPNSDQIPPNALPAYNLSRSILHSQDMGRYIRHQVIPKGLQVNITCATIGKKFTSNHEMERHAEKGLNNAHEHPA